MSQNWMKQKESIKSPKPNSRQQHLRKVKATLNSHHKQFWNTVKEIVWQRGAIFQVPHLMRGDTHTFSGLAFTILLQHHPDALIVHVFVVRVWDAHPGLEQQPSGILIRVRAAFVKAANWNVETCVLLKAAEKNTLRPLPRLLDIIYVARGTLAAEWPPRGWGFIFSYIILFCKLVPANRDDGPPPQKDSGMQPNVPNSLFLFFWKTLP